MPADGLALNGAKLSAATVLTADLHYESVETLSATTNDV